MNNFDLDDFLQEFEQSEFTTDWETDEVVDCESQLHCVPQS